MTRGEKMVWAAVYARFYGAPGAEKMATVAVCELRGEHAHEIDLETRTENCVREMVSDDGPWPERRGLTRAVSGDRTPGEAELVSPPPEVRRATQEAGVPPEAPARGLHRWRLTWRHEGSANSRMYHRKFYSTRALLQWCHSDLIGNMRLVRVTRLGHWGGAENEDTLVTRELGVETDLA